MLQQLSKWEEEESVPAFQNQRIEKINPLTFLIEEFSQI
jgi:hypothetical protein